MDKFNLKRAVAVSLIGLVVVHLLFTYILADANFLRWSEDTRGFEVFCFLLVFVVAFGSSIKE